MTEMNMIASLNALDNMLEVHDNVVIFGEDVGYFGGVFRVTDGLQEKHGAHRVFDALAEGGIAAIALVWVERFATCCRNSIRRLYLPAYDQIVNEIAKLRHRSGGEFSTPVTIRTLLVEESKVGTTIPKSRIGLHTPGLVVYCSNPNNAKGFYKRNRMQ